MMDTPPRSIQLDADRLQLVWTERTLALDAALLRRSCRCTQCRAELLGGGRLAVTDAVVLTRVELVGLYGLQLIFSDGHERGIYPWSYLHDLAQTS